jgi:hypothetical protein
VPSATTFFTDFLINNGTGELTEVTFRSHFELSLTLAGLSYDPSLTLLKKKEFENSGLAPKATAAAVFI